jgi:hypothetical protein
MLIIIGEANVRRNFSDTPSGDFMAKGTFGFVFRVTKEDDEKLHAKYSQNRVRTVEYMAVKTPEAGTPSGMAMLPVTFYWDPRNTCDGPSRAKFDKEEQIKWNTGLSRLKTAGVPPWYIARIVKIALGVQRDENPIYVNPQALFYTPPTTTQQPAPPQLQPAPTRPPGQTMIGRAEEAIPTKPQSAPAPAKPANRPQPPARSQSDPNRTGPNIKFVKKRLSEDSDDGGQPQPKKKKNLKKPPPGPSSLRKSSLA